jgi:hypothetical protein
VGTVADHVDPHEVRRHIKAMRGPHCRFWAQRGNVALSRGQHPMNLTGFDFSTLPRCGARTRSERHTLPTTRQSPDWPVQAPWRPKHRAENQSRPEGLRDATPHAWRLSP